MSRAVSASLAVLAIAGFARADDADTIPAEKRKQIIETMKSRIDARSADPKREKELTDQLAAGRAGTVNPKLKATVKGEKMQFPSKAAQEKFIAATEGELKKLAALPKPPVTDPAAYAGPLWQYKVGDFGVIHQEKIRVVRVVDKSTVVVSLYLPIIGPATPKEIKTQPATRLILSGLDTSAMADDTALDRPTEVFYIPGNRKVGASTHLHLVALRLTADERAALVGK